MQIRALWQRCRGLSIEVTFGNCRAFEYIGVTLISLGRCQSLEISREPTGSGEDTFSRRKSLLRGREEILFFHHSQSSNMHSSRQDAEPSNPLPVAPIARQDAGSSSSSGSGQNCRCWVQVKILEEDIEIEAYYTQIRFLGEGGFGQTWEVIPVDYPEKRFAMKIQQKIDEHLNPEVEQMRLYKEILIMNRILPRHKNIVRIEDCLISRNNVYLITELCAPVNMSEFFWEADATSGRRVFKQLAEAVHFMHQYGVFHNDLTHENILFADSDFMEAKIIDFGISIYCPELATLNHRQFNPRDWLEEQALVPAREVRHWIDEMRLGYILCSILCRHPIGFGRSGVPIAGGTVFRPRTDVFDKRALDLLALIGPRVYGPDKPEERLPVARVLEHPWLTGGNLNQPVLRDVDKDFVLLQTDWSILSTLLRDRGFIIPLKVLFLDGELLNHYHILGNLQRGGVNTQVLECADAPARTTKYAMKITRKNPDGTPEDETTRGLMIYNELLVTLRILPRHEGIVRIHDVLVHKQFVVVVKELCGRQTLEDFLPFARNDQQNSRRIFKQIAETVRFMHRYGVVHRNLQPQHIVFTDTQFTNCKIVNFSKACFKWGLAKEKHENFQANKWIPPEISLKFHVAQDIDDIQDLGRILHAMMVGVWEPIFFGENADIRNIKHPQVGVFDQAAQDLLSKIGPPPFGPVNIPMIGPYAIKIEQVCLHPWLAADVGLEQG